MARSTPTIQALIIANLQLQPELSGLSSPKPRSVWRLITYVIAVAINSFEVILDTFKGSMQQTVALSAPSTPQWLQNMTFKFQYSATNPQTILINPVTGVPAYPVIDPTLNIITRCAVFTSLSNQVGIKVAKLSPPQALLPAELSAVQSFVNAIGIAGINYPVTSSNPDQVYIQAQVYYQGQYAAIILSSITQSIQNFLANTAFNGNLKVSDLEQVIRNTAGVNDVLIQNLSVRLDSQTQPQGTFLIQNQVLKTPQYLANPTLLAGSVQPAGYYILEQSAGQTLAQTLTLTPQ